MTILKEYIKNILEQLPEEVTEVSFDIGVGLGFIVDNESPNRVKFKVGRK